MRKPRTEQQLEFDLRGKDIEKDPVRKFVLEIAHVVPMILSAAENAKRLDPGNVAHSRASLAWSLTGLHDHLRNAVEEIQETLNAGYEDREAHDRNRTG